MKNNRNTLPAWKAELARLSKIISGFGRRAGPVLWEVANGYFNLVRDKSEFMLAHNSNPVIAGEVFKKEVLGGVITLQPQQLYDMIDCFPNKEDWESGDFEKILSDTMAMRKEQGKKRRNAVKGASQKDGDNERGVPGAGTSDYDIDPEPVAVNPHIRNPPGAGPRDKEQIDPHAVEMLEERLAKTMNVVKKLKQQLKDSRQNESIERKRRQAAEKDARDWQARCKKLEKTIAHLRRALGDDAAAAGGD